MFRAASGIVLQSALLGVDVYIGIGWVFLMILFVCFVHHHKRGLDLPVIETAFTVPTR
jgi:hypothetical protein